MKDFLVEPKGNKFLIRDRKMQYTGSRLEYLQQKVRCTISLFLGEWFLDGTLGIPYIPKDDDKSNQDTLIATALQTKIASVKGVRKLALFETSHDKGTRTFTVNFIAETDAGDTFSDSAVYGG